MLKCLPHLRSTLARRSDAARKISDGQIKIDAAGSPVLIVVLGMIYACAWALSP